MIADKVSLSRPSVSAYISEPDAYRRAAVDSAAAVKTRSLVDARIRAMHATQEIFSVVPPSVERYRK
jgi:hypothetical protein